MVDPPEESRNRVEVIEIITIRVAVALQSVIDHALMN
jgi:hypothetical protein